eukprot:scaffold113145_cov36-Phaeocystis_antarctica.AAC.1
MVRYQAAKQVRGSYYAIRVRGYAVLTGVDVRCHARGHPEPSNQALSPNRRWTRRRRSASSAAARSSTASTRRRSSSRRVAATRSRHASRG